MISQRIENATRILAEDQDEYDALAIRDEVIDGHNVMHSLWQPEPAELAQLLAGGGVRLTILGQAHPPVLLGTQPAPHPAPFPAAPRRNADHGLAIVSGPDLAAMCARKVEIAGVFGMSRVVEGWHPADELMPNTLHLTSTPAADLVDLGYPNVFLASDVEAALAMPLGEDVAARVEANADLTLWCVHVLGPDDLFAMPDHAGAVLAAEQLNRAVLGQAGRPKEVLCYAYAAPWPHGAEAHTEDLQRYREEWHG